MPSSSTAAHRGRRHRHSKRHRRIILSSHPDGSSRRQQRQKQAANKDKECFDHYQQRSRNHLPNVSNDDAPTGSSGSRFSILETVDISSSPLHMMMPPQCDFTFKKRHLKSDPHTSLATHPSPQSNSTRRPEINNDPVQPTSEDVALGLNHSAVPTTPLSDLEEPLPAAYSLCSGNTNLQAEITSLNDVVIPSPLLYHRESCRDLLGVDSGEDALSKSTFNQTCGQDPLDTDVSVESFRLGSPLQPPGDGFKPPSFDVNRLIALDDEDFPAVHDPVVYQRSRAYVTFPPEGNGKCAIQEIEPLCNSILATTGTLRKRQAHVYPGDFGPTPPPTPPLSTRTPSRPLSSRIEQHRSTAAAIVSRYDSVACNNRSEMNVDVALPSLRLYPLSSASGGKVDYEHGGSEMSPRIFPPHGDVQEAAVQGDDSGDVLVDSFRTASDGETVHHRDPEMQAEFESREQAGEGVRTSHDKLDFHCERIRLMEGPDSSSIHSSSADTTDMSRATTSTTLDLPVRRPSLCQPVLQPLAVPASPSLSLARPASPHHESSMAPGLNLVQMQACPTKGCSALLLLAPTPRKLEPLRVQSNNQGPDDRNSDPQRHDQMVPFWETTTDAADVGIVIIATVHRGINADVFAGDGNDCDGSGRLHQGRKSKIWSPLSSTKGEGDPGLHMQNFTEIAAARVAEELGFGLEHEERCRFGVRFNHDKGPNGAPVRAGIRPPNNSSTRETGSEESAMDQGGNVSTVVMQVEGQVEDDVEDEDGWVGEGEGSEFWDCY